MNIFKFEFKRLLRSGITWSVVCGGLILLFMALFPSMKDMGMQELVGTKMDALPSDILKAFNIDKSMDFSNIYYFLGYCIQYIAMASAIYAGILGVNSLIREESQGTIEFLYSKPITRTKIVTNKLLSSVTIYYLYLVIVGIVTMGICIVVKPSDIDVMDLIYKIKLVFIGIALLGLVFLSLGMLISTLIKNDRGAISISIGIFFVSYFMGIISKLKDSFEFMKYLSPFDYFVPNQIINDGFETKFVVISIGIIVVSIVSTYIIYRKKDMKI